MRDYSRELRDLSCRIWDYAELKFDEERSAGALALREPANDGFSTLEGLGRTLLSPEEGGALVPFELMTALLLAALVGAVVVARRTEEDR